MYHDILADQNDPDASGFSGEDAATYKIDEVSYKNHLKSLSEQMEAEPIVLRGETELEKLRSRETWCLTFDDGGVSASDLAAEALENYDWRGHFFITTKRLGKPGFLNDEHVRELHSRGHVIGSHSHSHPPRISELPFDAIVNEWKTSIDILQSILGKEASLDVASVPGGFYSPAVGQAASEVGIRFLFTSRPVSHLETIATCSLLGRYAIRHKTSSSQAVAFAAGDWKSTTSLRIQWSVRSLAKRLGKGRYEKARKMLLRR